MTTTQKPACTSCGSTELFSKITRPGADVMPTGLFYIPDVDVVVCGRCGHIHWFARPETLEKVRSTFTPL